MTLFNLAILLLPFLSFKGSDSTNYNDNISDSCELTVDVSINVNDVDLKVNNGAEPIRYFVTDSKMKLLSEKATNNDLKKGVYHFYILDKDGCSKKGQFQVK